MKKILLIALLALSANISAQWEIVEFTDEWGDKNGRTAMRQIDMDGKFTNSATQNTKCPVVIDDQIYNGLLVFQFLEYGSSAAHFSDYNTYKIRIKRVDGTTNVGTLKPTSNNLALYMHRKHEVAQEIINGDKLLKVIALEVDSSTKYWFVVKP